MVPTITLTSPLNSDTNVARNKVITVNFSTEMDASSINTTTFTLKQAGITVLGTVSYSGTSASFTPSTVLAANTIYTASITTGVKNFRWNMLWQFQQGNGSFTTTANTSARLSSCRTWVQQEIM